MTLDSWNDLFNAAAVALIGITFVVSMGALLTGRAINRRQSTELIRLSTELTKAHTVLAEQQERTANAERDLALVRSRLSQRAVDDKGKLAMLAILRSVSGAGPPIDVDAVGGGDDESYVFAKQLADIMRDAGWPIGSIDAPLVLGPGFTGIAILIGTDKDAPPRALALKAALDAAGYPSVFTTDNQSHPDGRFKLDVGLKPK